MENQQQQAAAAISQLCKAGCGFFGSSSTEGLCSKCFKDSIKKKQDTGRSSPQSSITSSDSAKYAPMLRDVMEAAVASAVSGTSIADPSPSISSSSSAVSLAIETSLGESTGAEASTSVPDTVPSAVKNKPNRCQVCKKRVGLTGFPCRCGGLYCAEHRYDTAHDCQFDYKTIEREEIRKNNPLVVTEKIQRI